MPELRRTADEMRKAGYRKLTFIDPRRRVMQYLEIRSILGGKRGTWKPEFTARFGLDYYRWEPDDV